MLLLIDNYDSFTYNLAQYFGELGADVRVFRNDALTVEEIARLGPEQIVISPGPGNPDQAGITLEVIRRLSGQIPILGVCLGHQAIGQAFGGRVVRAPVLMHGKTSHIHHLGIGVFQQLPIPFQATRYHSLVVAADTIPDALQVTAWTEDGLVMGLRHKTLPVEGVQFHPESILTERGHDLLANFLRGA
ncbi:MAG: aminodeoxychorismate/anthranilate synthase component II [Magnetococcales bacterium]|nr:aminodeoxychorismate/anthranilate synthase component II [Magnetococcales bacterium]